MSNHPIDTARLLDSELFAGLGELEAAPVLEIAASLEVAAGGRVFLLGQDANSVFVIDRGRVALTLPLAIEGDAREVEVQQKDVRAVIGWSALVAPHHYTMSARAVDDCLLVSFSRSKMSEIFEQHPRINAVIQTNLARVVASRLTQLQAILVRDLQRWVSERMGG